MNWDKGVLLANSASINSNNELKECATKELAYKS